MAALSIPIAEAATAASFDEACYLAANPDVAAAVAAGKLKSGRAHFDYCGQAEGRRQKGNAEPLRAAKAERLRPLMRDDLPHRRVGHIYDYLTDELRAAAGIADTENVSANAYDSHVLSLIDDCTDGLVLDCGAGRRDRYYANVVNLEIVDYESTDVLGIGEVLPFRDASFEAVISLAVLEHVRDPFACAREIARVLKPGGRLICAVPFLQPLHGYPHHYFNMTHEGLRSLFEGRLAIDAQFVPPALLPVWSLSWIVQSWAGALPEAARRDFLSRPLSDFLGNPVDLLDRPFVTALSHEANLELASGTYLFAHKER